MKSTHIENFWDEHLLDDHLNFESEQLHVLTALYGVACQGDASPAHIEIAKNLELLKASSLILDDFLDKSPIRNGLASLYNKVGPEQAVLIAEVLHSTALIEFCKVIRGYDPKYLFRAMCIFEETYRTICVGQLWDLRLQSQQLSSSLPTESDYFQMITYTSAVFIQSPLILGALLSERSKEVASALGEYGLKIGLAYQIRDDVLDLIAPSQLTGKPEAGDLRSRKKRLPLIRLRDRCSPRDLRWLVQIFNSNDGFPMEDEVVAKLIEMMNSYSVITSCEQTIRELCIEALASLGGLVEGAEFDQLSAIADLLTEFSFLSED